MSLMREYGLTDRFMALASMYPEHTVARVVSQEKNLYRIVTDRGEHLAAVSGRFRNEVATVSDFPTVGDFVMVDPNEAGNAVIHAVLQRRGVFIRKAAGTDRTEQTVAANVDVLFLCMALNSDFNVRRLERYMSIAWNSGATPVVVLTKADLCDDLSARLRETAQAAPGADVIVTSSVEADGIDKLLPYIKSGKTAALIGSSGVGKSTLINRLLGEERIKTNGLRDDDKGRHTTTHRELILLPRGGMLIDTPGMRELGIWDSGEGVDAAFSDIEELASRCRFGNCSHSGEPGCAVRDAIANGSLSEARFASFLKLTKESEYALDSESYIRTKSEKFKNIAQINKNSKKAKY